VVGGTLVGDAPSSAPPATVSPTATATGDVPARRDSGGRSGGSRTPLLIGGAVVGVIAIGAVAAFALGGGDGNSKDTTVVVSTTVTAAPASGNAGAASSGGAGETGAAASTAAADTTAPVDSTGPSDSGATSTPVDTGSAAGAFPPATAQGVVDIAKRPVPFSALYDLIQGGNAGTLLLNYDGDARISYRVRLKGQGTIWAGFDGGAIKYGCVQVPGLDTPVCTDGTDREKEYRSLIEQFVNGLLSADAVQTNFGDLAAQGPPVLPGEATGQPVACIQSVGSATARLCVREDSIITEVTVVEQGKEVGARARRASTSPSEDDFSPPTAIS
jgi:hypothetical protein